MARKKKLKKFSAAKAVKAAARERVGPPKPVNVEPSKPRPREKHKATLGRLLAEE
jgi:hypothetical protein